MACLRFRLPRFCVPWFHTVHNPFFRRLCVRPRVAHILKRAQR